MKKAVMYGAGNIGRGFIGQLFSQSGYEVTFIDINEAVINELNRKRKYTVSVMKQDCVEDITVENVRGVLGVASETVAGEMADADIMAMALGVNVLKYVIRHLAAGAKIRIDEKRPLNIIICENLLDADKVLRRMILSELPDGYAEGFDRFIGLVKASIGRMVPVMERAEDVLRVNVEEYCFLPVDKSAFKGGIPDIKNMYPYSPFSLFVERKLYMHNMSHAMTAYLGALKGYTYIYEAIRDGGIYSLVYSALVRCATALAAEHGGEIRPLLDHASNLLYRFANKNLKDTIARVGRDTKRKLSAGDRLSGAVELLDKHGIYCGYLFAGIAAALLFQGENDAESAEVAMLAENSVKNAAERFMSITDESKIKSISAFYEALKNTSNFIGIMEQCGCEENNKPIL